jgi:Na+/proline symporter
MSNFTFLIVIAIYFALLLLISYITGRKQSDNKTFFLANRQSLWWIVAIGMIGSSISGVSFVSVPGMVGKIDFTYMQTVFGFFFGYIVIAKVLLPLYYKLNLTTIYTYLAQRIGKRAYKTGASFFLLSKIIGAATRLYIVALILQLLMFDSLKVPFTITVLGTVFLIWLYTFRNGIKTIIWTDTLQTFVMIVALVIIMIQVFSRIDFGETGVVSQLVNYEHTRIFVFDDWYSKQNFFKQFFSGIFIAIVMTGLDQDMMQKNLSCKNLHEAQKNMYWYGFAFIPVNLIFLLLGAGLLLFATQNQIILPENTDEILPFLASNYLGNITFIIFAVGIIAAAFSSADSALAALTTSFYVDILNIKNKTEKQEIRYRLLIHTGISVLFALVIIAIKALNSQSIIDLIYTIASYTYGPLLGMFAFGLFTKRQTNDSVVPYVAVLSPAICYFLNFLFTKYLSYQFGYELLMLNGLITFMGLYFCRKKEITAM